MTLNIVSLMALSLSVGLIIDDAIVVRENIFRHMEMGKTPKEASSEGTAEVAMPVVAMSLTIVSVFLPIAFVGGLIGKFLNSFGLVVSIAVLISLVEALTFAPMLSAYLFKQQKTEDRRGGRRHLGDRTCQPGADRERSICARWAGRCATGWSRWCSASPSWRSACTAATHLNQSFMPTVDQGSVNVVADAAARNGARQYGPEGPRG